MKTRVISGIVLLIGVILVVRCAGYVLLFTLLGVSLIGMHELMRAFDLDKAGDRRIMLVADLCAILYYFFIWLDAERYGLMALAAALILLLFVYVFSWPHVTADQVLPAYFSLIYVAVMLSYVYRMRILPQGWNLCVLTFIASWGCDTCAYFAGSLLGRHKMAPVLSPKKSIEGAVGGILGAALLGGLFGAVSGSDPFRFALIGAAGAPISMVGDLAASAIKRNRELKDYGTLIPGHGGILERFDSVIITAPVIYYLAVFILYQK